MSLACRARILFVTFEPAVGQVGVVVVGGERAPAGLAFQVAEDVVGVGALGPVKYAYSVKSIS
jgi:hypothetical protein